MSEHERPAKGRPLPLSVAVHDYGGYPFITDLSRELARRGHQVLHLYADGFRRPKAAMGASADDPDALEFAPVNLAEPLRRGGVRRIPQERRYGRMLARRIARYRPDIVISANAPLDVQAAAARAARSIGAAYVFWLQDLHSIAIAQIVGRRARWLGTLVGHRFTRLEQRLLCESDWVVPISGHFVPVLKAWGVDLNKVTVVENWAPLPHEAQAGMWEAGRNYLAGSRLLYAGTLALKHNPGVLLALARNIPEAVVIVVSEGPGAEWLMEHGADLENLHVLPFQPFDQLDSMLASADILLAVLEEDASSFSAPSKVLTYLSAGRPVLAAMPSANPAAETIVKAKAGLVVDPRDPEQFVAAAKQMLADDEGRREWQRSATQYAKEAFDLSGITDRFESILESAIDRKSASTTKSPSDTVGSSGHGTGAVE